MGFHFLKWVTKNIDFFRDILILWYVSILLLVELEKKPKWANAEAC